MPEVGLLFVVVTVVVVVVALVVGALVVVALVVVTVVVVTVAVTVVVVTVEDVVGEALGVCMFGLSFLICFSRGLCLQKYSGCCRSHFSVAQGMRRACRYGIARL